jgi:Zn-dependent metalloprotease
LNKTYRALSRLLLPLGVLVAAGLASRSGGVQQPTYGELATPMQWKQPAVIRPAYAPAPALGQPDDSLIRGAVVQKDVATGQVRRVRGRVAVPGAKTAEQAARGFLTSNARALGLSAGLTELRKVREVQSLAGVHVTFEQVYGGLPVFGGRLSVHMDKQLAVRTVNHDLVPIPNAAVRLVMPANSQAAVNAAVAAVNIAAGPAQLPASVGGVKVVNGSPLAVWKVTFKTRFPGASWEVYVNAMTNAVVSVNNVAKYAGVDGSGMAFLPNPVNSSGISSLVDNDNADSPTLTAQRFPVVLRELDASNTLSGPYCSTGITTALPHANEPSHVFNYTRSDTRFEEVMCYYHIDTIERYIQSLGFTTIQNRQMSCDANVDPDFYNAYYSTSDQSVNFGGGGVDFAEDADVIWHECGHAIQDNQVPGFGASEEAGAMGEGFGDYWACSYHATLIGPQSPNWDIYLGTWVSTFYVPGDPAYTRVLNSTKHYPEDLTYEVHDDGEIWSACLWQIRGIVGRARADKMILESHFSVSPFASFLDGAIAIVDANDALFAGADRDAIIQVFTDRGIWGPLPPPSPPPALVFFAINNGPLYTASPWVKLTNVAFDADEYMASEDPSFSGATWEPYESEPWFQLSPGNGLKTVYLKVRNSGGETEALSDTIMLMEKPVVTYYALNGGAASTASKTITLDNACSGAPSIYIASENSSFYGASWKPYSTNPNFTLSGGVGYKRVYFKVRNSMGESHSVNRIIFSSTR